MFAWAGLAERTLPELRLMYAVPNGGHRHKAVAARLKATGVKSGVPDVVLPVARHGYHSLYIEMKAMDGHASKTQRQWIEDLACEGHKAIVVRGFKEARDQIVAYLKP